MSQGHSWLAVYIHSLSSHRKLASSIPHQHQGLPYLLSSFVYTRSVALPGNHYPNGVHARMHYHPFFSRVHERRRPSGSGSWMDR